MLMNHIKKTPENASDAHLVELVGIAPTSDGLIN